MVFFKDKSGTPFSLAHPEDFLSARSLARRTKQGIAVNSADLPVFPGYVTTLQSNNTKTYFTTRWMNGVLAEMDAGNVSAISALPFVDSVILVAPGSKFSGGRIKKTQNITSSADGPATTPQLMQLGLDDMHSNGIHGENVSVALMDGGFSSVDQIAPFQSLFAGNRIKMTYNFVNNTPDVYQNCNGCEHGTEVLSIISVNTPTFTGGAYGADFFLFVTEDNPTEYRIEEYNWLFAAEKADSAGVDLISTSLGYSEFDDPAMSYTISQLDGRTTVIARAATQAMARGIVVVCSAGNEGNNSWRYITSPADAIGILSCGAIDAGGSLVNFSSRGPSGDGRIKPDVVALGSGNKVILTNGTIGTNSGTSFASPLVASLAAGVLQEYPYLTAPQVYDAIIKSADRASNPDNDFGYGVPHYAAIKSYIETSGTVSLYPNPAKSNYFKLEFKYDVGETTVVLFDLLGRILSQRDFMIDSQTNIITYDLSDLAAGVYFVKVKSSRATKIIRLVKS